MTASAWEMRVRQDDFATAEVAEVAVPQPDEGQALLRVDRVGLTANNVTYAAVGDSMSYWSFFPTEPGWGRVPLWGFAEVVASRAEGLAEGARIFGYLPSSSHLVVQPVPHGPGFRDEAPHRASLPRAYNVYADCGADPSYEPEREDLQALYLPLFLTSFLLDDFLAGNGFFGAEALVFSSASSKTAYGTAFCTSERTPRPRLIGLTSPRNLGFTSGLGCYDEVVAYDGIGSLPATERTVYVDLSGDAQLRAQLHRHLGEALVHDAVVGMTHLDALTLPAEPLPGPAPEFFFAPDQMRKRRADWGPGGIEQRYAEVWKRFAAALERGWVEVEVARGSDGLRQSWLEMLAGGGDPRKGRIIAF